MTSALAVIGCTLAGAVLGGLTGTRLHRPGSIGTGSVLGLITGVVFGAVAGALVGLVLILAGPVSAIRID